MRPALWAGVPLLLVAMALAPLVHDAVGTLLEADPARQLIALDVVAIPCPEGFDNLHDEDDVCLSYGGAIPGPTLVVREDMPVEITLTNRIDETLDTLPVDASVKDALTGTRISLHTHGQGVAAGLDGVAAIEGTALVDSSVGPGESFTYALLPLYPGPWHYHDHVMGPDGAHGQARGLYGSILVLEEDEPSPEVLDLHLLDGGAHNGLGLDATAAAGERFDLVVVGLGNTWADVTLTTPAGVPLGTWAIGPGVSHRFVVADPLEGVYTWRATSPFFPGGLEGTITVEAPP